MRPATLICAVLALASCDAKTMPRPAATVPSDLPGFRREVMVWVDPATGCEYLATEGFGSGVSHSMTPRMEGHTAGAPGWPDHQRGCR